MREKLNTTLDIALKALSLLFILCVSIGTIVLWIYFNQVGISGEVASALNTPQILFTIAIYSMLVSVGIVAIFILPPRMINYCEGKDFQWASAWPSKMRKFAFHTFLVFLPLVVFLVALFLDASEYSILAVYAGLVILVASLFYKKYGGPLINTTENVRRHWGITVYVFFIMLSILLFSLLFIIKTVAYFGGDGWIPWLVLVVVVFLYSLSVGVASCTSGYIAYTPLTIISIVIVAVLFFDSGAANIAAKIGIGHFQTTLAVDAKSSAILKDSKKFKISPTSHNEVVLVEDAWILASLPNKLILSNTPDGEFKYTVFTSSLVGEIGNSAAKKAQAGITQ